MILSNWTLFFLLKQETIDLQSFKGAIIEVVFILEVRLLSYLSQEFEKKNITPERTFDQPL